PRARSSHATRARARRRRPRAQHLGRHRDVERGTGLVFAHHPCDDVALRVGGCQARLRAPMMILRGIAIAAVSLGVAACRDGSAPASPSHPDDGGVAEAGIESGPAEAAMESGPAGTLGCEPRFPYQDEPDL